MTVLGESCNRDADSAIATGGRLLGPTTASSMSSINSRKAAESSSPTSDISVAQRNQRFARCILAAGVRFQSRRAAANACERSLPCG